MKTKYRVVRDGCAGYEAQFKLWWFPFWLQCFGTNTRGTVERSKAVIELHKKDVELRMQMRKNKVVYREP